MVSVNRPRLAHLGERHLLSLGFLSILVVMLALLAAPSFAGAEVAPAPAWRVTTEAIPTVLPPGVGRRGAYYVAIENVGGVTSTGEITVKDVLPAGLSVTNVTTEPEGVSCPLVGDEVACSFAEEVIPSGFI